METRLKGVRTWLEGASFVTRVPHLAINVVTQKTKTGAAGSLIFRRPASSIAAVHVGLMSAQAA